MGSSTIDLSLSNIWRMWYLFRRGKKRTRELDTFEYYLERNLYELWEDLHLGFYRHGSYRTFMSFDNKKREISVASIRDRVVHRLLYEYLIAIYDKTFIYDVWSCRRGKGLLGAIERTEDLLHRFPHSFVWRTDIKKFFDSVDQGILISILARKPRLLGSRNPTVGAGTSRMFLFALLKEVIGSYVSTYTHTHTHTEGGSP